MHLSSILIQHETYIGITTKLFTQLIMSSPELSSDGSRVDFTWDKHKPYFRSVVWWLYEMKIKAYPSDELLKEQCEDDDEVHVWKRQKGDSMSVRLELHGTFSYKRLMR